MQLAEQGLFDINQPLRNTLPDFSIKTRYPDTAEITPRQLIMTHHSGLPRDWLKGFMTAHSVPFADLKNDIRNDCTAYPPNTIFSYSNIGIILPGDAIQQQSDIPFALTPTESSGEKACIPLIPVSDNEGLLLGPLNDGGETVRVVMVDGEERVLFRGYLLRKIVR